MSVQRQFVHFQLQKSGVHRRKVERVKKDIGSSLFLVVLCSGVFYSHPSLVTVRQTTLDTSGVHSKTLVTEFQSLLSHPSHFLLGWS